MRETNPPFVAYEQAPGARHGGETAAADATIDIWVVYQPGRLRDGHVATSEAQAIEMQDQYNNAEQVSCYPWLRTTGLIYPTRAVNGYPTHAELLAAFVQRKPIKLRGFSFATISSLEHEDGSGTSFNVTGLTESGHQETIHVKVTA